MSIVARLAAERDLVIVKPDALTLRRRRRGKGFAFVTPSGAYLRDAAEIGRLKALAVPPAYANVRFAADANAHLQAVGEDAAGRLQYRYHPRWAEVREVLKARRLARLARSLPTIRRAVTRSLASPDIGRRFVAAAIVELVRLTAIRAGREEYARERGTRGAATLLKSNVRLGARDAVTLCFKAKGGRIVTRRVKSRCLHAAVTRLMELPGRRLFQCNETGSPRPVGAAEVNVFLREVAGRRISLKDFRTLVASTAALETLAGTRPAASDRQRRRQVRDAVAGIAERLGNTPAVCRASYVHGVVIEAFESGALKRARIGKARSAATPAELLARLVERHDGMTPPGGERRSIRSCRTRAG